MKVAQVDTGTLFFKTMVRINTINVKDRDVYPRFHEHRNSVTIESICFY